MSSRRDFPQDRFGRGREDRRSFSREPHRGGPYGGGPHHQDGGHNRWEWDADSREDAQHGASQDRFGGYSDSMDYGNPYASRRQSGGSHQSTWDEDRFGYPESSYGQERGHGGRSSPGSGHGPQDRFAEDRHSWGREYGGGSAHPSRQWPRHFEPRQSSAWDPSWGKGASGGRDFDRGSSDRGGGGPYAGGRSSYGGDRGGMFGGWGIPSGSELGGYEMNGPDDGGPHNWSGSNWGNQDRGGDWGGRHSGRFSGSHADAFGRGEKRMQGRTPKGYTRSDDRIRDDVCEQLYRTPDVDVSDVTVEARNGTVMLEGTVPDRRMKHRIEDLCEQCLGVQDVENRIRVQRAQGDGSRLASSSSPQMDPSSAGSGTSATPDRSNKKSSTGTSSSPH